MHRLSRKLATMVGLLGLLSTGLVTGTVAPASANHTPGDPAGVHTVTLKCGDVIGTAAPADVIVAAGETVKLAANVGPCPFQDTDGDLAADWGIKVTASTITLDLNGKSVLGCTNPLDISAAGSVSVGITPGTPPTPTVNNSLDLTGCNAPDPTRAGSVPDNGPDGAYTLGEGIGVFLSGVDNVTVQNGTVSYFDQGVVIAGGSLATPSSTSTACTGGANNTVQNLTVSENINTVTSAPPPRGEGVSIEESDGNNVLNNTIRHNGGYAGVGQYGNSNCNEIDGNTIANNNTHTSTLQFQTSGVRLEGGSHAVITDNTISGSSLDGISVFARNAWNQLLRNTITNNGFHHGTGGNRQAAPVGHHAVHGDGSGPYLRAEHRLGDGIRMPALTNNNTISDNVVCGNAGSGIRLDGPFSVAVGGAFLNTVSNNDSGGGDCVGLAALPSSGHDHATHGAPGHTDLCEVGSGHNVTGGVGCSKNNVGKDPRSPYTVENNVARNEIRRQSADLYDGNKSPACGTNTWSGDTPGVDSSWPPALPLTEYDDRTNHNVVVPSCID